MKISVMVPSYNQGEFIGQTLQSIVDQQAGDKELIVIDNGSTDNSLEVIRSYEQHIAYWVTRENRGLSNSLATGLNRCTGDIMCFICSDDFFDPNAFRAVLQFFSEHPEVDVLYGDMNWVTRDGSFLKPKKEIDLDVNILLWDYCYIPLPSTFWRRRIWERSGGIDESLACSMDYDLWLRFVKAGAKFAHIPVVLSSMRFYPEQRNQRLHSLSNREDAVVRERFLRRRPSRIEWAMKKTLHKTRRVAKRLAAGAYW